MVLVVYNGSIRSIPQFLGWDVEEGSAILALDKFYRRAGEFPKFDPDYALVKDSDGRPYFALCGTVYDSTLQLYQPSCAAKGYSDELVAVSGVYCEDVNTCYRAVVVNDNGEWRVYKAPVIIELMLDNGDIIDVPMGIVCGGLCIMAGILIGGAIAGWVVHTLTVEKPEAEAKKELADVLVKHLEKCSDYKCVTTILGEGVKMLKEIEVKSSVNVASWVESAKQFFSQFAAPLGAILGVIITVLKMQLIIDVFRSLLRRR